MTDQSVASETPLLKNNPLWAAFLGLPLLAGCGRMDTAPDLQKQIARLQGDSADEHYTALKNLQTLAVGGAAAVPELRALLKRAKDDDLKAEIARTLGSMGSAAGAAVPDLVAMLDSKAAWPRYCAATALGTMEAAALPALPKLIPLMKDPDRDVAQAAKEAARRLDRLRRTKAN